MGTFVCDCLNDETLIDEAWRVIDTAAPELPPLILDTMIWSVCSGEVCVHYAPNLGKQSRLLLGHGRC